MRPTSEVRSGKGIFCSPCNPCNAFSIVPWVSYISLLQVSAVWCPHSGFIEGRDFHGPNTRSSLVWSPVLAPSRAETRVWDQESYSRVSTTSLRADTAKFVSYFLETWRSGTVQVQFIRHGDPIIFHVYEDWRRRRWLQSMILRSISRHNASPG